MIKIGKLTDYAVVLMGQLSKEGESVSRSAHYLADKTGVPEPTVAKILKVLAQEGLVDSVRGAAGGYRLARAPAQISIADIITALDGPIAIVACADGGDGGDCRIAANCPVKGNWDRVNGAIRTVLEGVKLTEMTGASAACCQQHDFIRETKSGGAGTK